MDIEFRVHTPKRDRIRGIVDQRQNIRGTDHPVRIFTGQGEHLFVESVVFRFLVADNIFGIEVHVYYK